MPGMPTPAVCGFSPVTSYFYSPLWTLGFLVFFVFFQKTVRVNDLAGRMAQQMKVLASQTQ